MQSYFKIVCSSILEALQGLFQQSDYQFMPTLKDPLEGDGQQPSSE
jgi:hypothetical protein